MTNLRRLRTGLTRATAALLVAGLAACAGPKDPDAFVHDPYMETNRDIHAFNKGLDTVALRPAAYVYGAAAPTLVKHLVSNAFDTLDMPAIAINHLLQGDVSAALRAAGRLGVNLVGGLGVLDPATEFGLPREDSDFGLTLASWGVGEGAYVELPLLGPSTERDAVGTAVNFALNPVSWVTAYADISSAITGGARALEAVDFRESNYDLLDRLLYESEDSYVAAQSAYLQLRRRAVSGDEASADSVPDVFAE